LELISFGLVLSADPAMAAMSQFGVLVRYPGTWATLSEAQHGI
jgi:hypothetical protein